MVKSSTAMPHVFVAVLLVSFGALVTPSLAALQYDTCTGCGAALTELLSNVTIQIPDQQFAWSALNLSIKDITCNDIQVGTLDIASSDSDVHLVLGSAGLRCVANYHHVMTVFPYLSGSGLVFGDPENSNVTLQVDYFFDNDSVPTGLNASVCVAQINLNVTLSGGPAAFIADILIFVFKPFLQSALDGWICDAASKLITVNGTHLFQELNPVVHELMDVSPTLDIPPPPATGSVDFAEFGGILTAIDKIINSSTESGTFLVDELLGFILGGNLNLFDLGLEITLGDDGLSDTNLTIENVVISGLNTFTDLHLLKPVHIAGYPGNYSLELAFALDEIALYADGNVSLGPGSLIIHGKGTVQESAFLNLSLQQVVVNVIVQLEISEHEISHIKFGQLANSFVGCLGKFVSGTNATFVNVSIGGYTVPYIGGFGNVSPIFNELIHVVDEMFGKIIFKVLHGALGTGLKNFLNVEVNNIIAQSRANIENECPEDFPLPNPDEDIVDFYAPVVLEVAELLKIFGVPSPINYSVNWLVDVISDMQGGIVMDTLGGVSTNAAGEFGLSKVNVSAAKLSVLNMDSFYSIDLVEPQSSTEITTSLGLGGPDREVNASLSLHLDLEGSAVQNSNQRILDDFDFKFFLGNLSLSLDLHLALRKSSFFKQNLASLLDLDSGCIFYIADNASLGGLQLAADGVSFDLDCHSCTSPKLNDWSSMLKGTAAPHDFHSDVMNLLGSLGSDDVLQLVNSGIAKKIAGSRTTCKPDTPPAADSSAQSSSPLVRTIVVCSLTGAFIGVALLYYFCIHRHRLGADVEKPIHDDEVKPVLANRDPEPILDENPPVDDRFGHAHAQFAKLALWKNDIVRPTHKWLIPALLVVDIGMFLAANNTVGASVNLIALFAGDTLKLPSLFSFSLGNSIREMWKAGVYPLALMILCFSGMWPYVKALMMLACWLAPPQKLALRHRKRIMHWLDILGKWSLVDAYVLVLMMVAFRFHIVTPSGKSYFPDQFIQADVIVYPGFGIHGFLIAAILQLVITHWIIYYDRRAAKAAQTEEDTFLDANSPRNSAPPVLSEIAEPSAVESKDGLVERVVSESLHEHEDPVAQVNVTKLAKFVMTVTLACSFFMTAVGVFIDSFRFEFKGAAGFALGDAATHSYSVVSVADTLLQPDAGVIFLWTVFLLFAVVVPCAQLLTLFCLWVIPLKRSTQKRALWAVEVLRAMGAIDVFIVSIIAALYELKQFVAFIIGDKCDSINALLSRFAGGSLGGEDVCFDVKAELAPKCWVLLLAAILGVGMTFVMLEICENALENQPDEQDGQDPVSSVMNWPVTVAYGKKLYNFLVAIKFIEPVHSPNQLKRSTTLR